MKILFLTKYFPEGASSRYRYYNYKDYFIKNGLDVEYKPLFRDGYVKNYYNGIKNKKINMIEDILKRIIFIIFNKKKYDFIIIEKELIMYCPYFVEYFLLRGTKYSLDFDDNPKAPYIKGFLKKLVYKNKIEKLIKNSIVTTVGNYWYYEEFKSEKLSYLPTVIDIDKYNEKLNYESKEITIVWIGSKSTLKYLNIIKSPLEKLSKKYPIRLKVIGGKITFDNIKVEYVDWKEETESKEIEKSDIGIMPLEDTYWEKGKCGFKLIQYMACGLPVVASPAPANEEIVIHEQSGFIAKTDEEWYEYLEKLILDINLRKELGKAGKKRIQEKYSYQRWNEKKINLIKKKVK